MPGAVDVLPRGAQAWSLPFWLVSAVTEDQLLPGLPMSALALVCPVTAAAILAYRQYGTAGVMGLLQRAFDTSGLARTEDTSA